MILRNLPNAVTLMRLILLVPFLLFLYEDANRCAFYLFLFAGFTDALDGWLARYFGWQSAFGTFIDPVADKLLIASSFIALALMGRMPWWIVALVFLRDAAIALGVAIWSMKGSAKFVLKPTYLSKLNTVMQLLLIIDCLYERAFSAFNPNLSLTLLILTTFTTALSFIDYALIWWKRIYPQITCAK